ncbi:Clp protease ClpP [Parachitinimonas caeni]|uniref:Clp protease ClpP n=1 Tax=Parachitinimonas caeni TaxID=3031301 RepID=A0ABT7E0S8_9NEIS|nr:Clp protease ClpP [Parachitinimonas caeni]MDK2124512.1 Clp protease ClpP [Parachitinimonas caeni]
MQTIALKASSEDDSEDGLAPQRYFQRYESQIAIHQISFYLSGEIGPPLAYTDLLSSLRSANETDLIYLHLNTPGGNFDTGLQIINNVRSSPARVITVLEARAYSMGALLFLAGDELLVHDNCQLMFHNYSGSFIGKGNEQHAQVMAIGRWFEKVMSRICHPFLSREEIDHILRGEDIWMDSDEIRRRLHKMELGQPTTKPKLPAKKKLANESGQ